MVGGGENDVMPFTEGSIGQGGDLRCFLEKPTAGGFQQIVGPEALGGIE